MTSSMSPSLAHSSSTASAGLLLNRCVILWPNSDVPYNPLLDQGYKSIGDWHSTAAPSGETASSAADADERSGRWAGQKAKTECGLHKDYFEMKKQFEARLKGGPEGEETKAEA